VNGVALGAKDLKVTVKRLGRLKARVLGPDGKLLARVRVKTLVAAQGQGPRRSSGFETLEQAATGLEIVLPVGEVEVTVDAPGHEAKRIFDARVEPGDQVAPGDVTLAKKTKEPEKEAEEGSEEEGEEGSEDE